MAVSEGNRLRVLVVEDEILIRIYLTNVLHSAGYAVIEAANGAEAISILDAGHDVDAVVSDIRMPGAIDGIALARVIQQRDSTIPVILASADSPSDGALPAHFAFLPKPFRPEAVLETVKRAIEERRISDGSGPGRADSRGRPSR